MFLPSSYGNGSIYLLFIWFYGIVANAISLHSRRNQMKKVIHHVPADGSSSDMWAWRKYGQKPIKGSPYPRLIRYMESLLL